MAQDWDIKPRGEACRQCNAPFADRQIYHSALVFGEDGYVRADYCGACWPACEKNASPYSMWKGVFKMPPPPPEEPLKKETAESLLRRMIEDDDTSKANVIFILAVMLERKRVLVEQDVRPREDGSLLRVYEHRKTGEVFLITDPRLRLDQIDQVQQEVLEMLNAAASAAGEPEPGAKSQAPGQNDPSSAGGAGASAPPSDAERPPNP